MWTASQRAVVLTTVFGILVYLSVRFAQQHTYISNPPPPDGALADQVANRIDPNTATRGMIAALPNIGEKLAQVIVDYREQYQQAHPGHAAFTRVEDLRAVRGIGPAKVESLADYLVFSPPPTTQPAH